MAKKHLYEKHIEDFKRIFGETPVGDSRKAIIVDVNLAAKYLEITDTAVRSRIRGIKKANYVVEKVGAGRYAIFAEKVESQSTKDEEGETQQNHTTNESIPQQYEQDNSTSMQVLVSKDNIEVIRFSITNINLDVVTMNDEVWFFADEVAEILEYDKTANMLRMVDDEDKAKISVKQNGKRVIKTIINESGLYTAIFHSRKPIAKRFKRWVTKEVLPSIRKHGAYITPQKIDEILLNPDTLIKLANELKKQLEAKNTLTKQLNECKPLMQLGEAIKESENSIMIEDWVKSISRGELHIGRNKAFKWLKQNGYLRKNRQPYQIWIDKGYFEWKPRIYYTKDGEQKEGFITLITPKGQLALTPLIIEDFKNKQGK